LRPVQSRPIATRGVLHYRICCDIPEHAYITQIIFNGQIFTGDSLLHEHAVVISGGLVARIVPQNEIPTDASVLYDLQGGTLVPGFIDLQVNGGGGILFNNAPTVDSLRVIGSAHRRFGTTGFLPTLITTSYEVMLQAVAAVEQAIDERVPGILGIHLEGPFLNPQRNGAHDPRQFRVLDAEGVKIATSPRAGRTLMTLAPELTTPELVGQLVEKGVIVCAGHSAADYNQTREALSAGVSGFTHLFNAMTPLTSRAPGMVGAALEDDDSWFGIIADGHHIHPAAFKVAIAAKKTGGAILVTDAMPTVGASSKSFVLDGQTITASAGRLINASGTLAGSDLDMLSAVNNATKYARIDWFEAVRMASLYPARALGLAGELGAIRPGYRANLVALDGQRRVRATWIDGEGA
jgi:N-acetylglucosamine-6-phosphate deacetylase